MLTETGRVVAIEDDGLWVETLKQSVCSQCAARKGCGQKLLANVSPSSNMTFIKALYSEKAESEIWAVGDQAILGIDKNALVVAALIAYGIPLVFLILGMLTGMEFGSRYEVNASGDAGAALGAVFGLILGAVVVKQHAKHSSRTRYFQAQVIGRNATAVNS